MFEKAWGLKGAIEGRTVGGGFRCEGCYGRAGRGKGGHLKGMPEILADFFAQSREDFS